MEETKQHITTFSYDPITRLTKIITDGVAQDVEVRLGDPLVKGGRETADESTVDTTISAEVQKPEES